VRGAAGVTTAVAQALAGHVPARLALLELENGPLEYGSGGTDTPEVVRLDPAPRFVAAGQRSADDVRLEDWPFLLVVAQRVASGMLDETGVSPRGAREYLVGYTLRIFVWARGDGFVQTTAVRDRLTLAVREVLLTHQQVAPWLRLDATTLDEAYSDVALDPDLASTIAAAWVGVVATSVEAVSPAGAPVVEEVAETEVAAAPLPPTAGRGVRAYHPALDD
jgi:hypothetical protein